MFTLTPKVADYFVISIDKVLKRYKLQWYGWNTKRHYVKKTRVLHDVSLQAVKDRAKLLFGSIPDYIQRI